MPTTSRGASSSPASFGRGSAHAEALAKQSRPAAAIALIFTVSFPLRRKRLVARIATTIARLRQRSGEPRLDLLPDHSLLEE